MVIIQSLGRIYGIRCHQEHACREFVYTSEQEIVIMRHVRIREFICFILFCPFHWNHHSRSLEGKYTFPGGIWWVLGREVRIGDLS